MKQIQCLAGLLLAFGALPLMARTLTVTDVEGDVVSLAFGDPDGKSYTIGVGYGSTDGGADKYGWTSFSNNLATVAADATTGTLTLPADLVAARAQFRLFLLQTTDLPYARELTYIASTSTSYGTNQGTQFIDTGIIGRSGTKMDCHYAWLAGDDSTILGARTGNTRFYVSQMYRTWWCKGYGSWGYGPNVGFTADKKMHVVCELKAGQQTLVVDDVQQYSDTNSSTINTGLNMYVFGCNWDGTQKVCIQAKLYDMSIWQDDVLVRQYRPVALASGDGALLDEVSGTVFANGSSTAFTLGADCTDEANRRGIVKATSATFSLTGSLAVTEFTESSLTVRLTGVGIRALYLASGTTDGGLDKYAWDSFDKLADISATQTSCTCAIPAGTRTGRYARLFLLRTTNLPYTRELASIASTGTQYIDTGIIGKDGTEMECDVALTASGSPDVTLIGSRTNSGHTRFFLAHVCRGHWGLSHHYWWEGVISHVQNEKVHLVSKAYVGSQTLTVNGQLCKSLADSTELNTGLNMYLFAANLYGSAKQFMSARLSNMLLVQDGALVRLFRPVVVDGKGALYDDVSGVVFTNQGSGDFTMTEADDETNRRGSIQAASVTYPAGTLIVDAASGGQQTVTVAEGATFPEGREINATSCLPVESTLEKLGAGTFVLRTAIQSSTPTVTVTAGLVQLGAENVVDARNTVTIADGAAFDVAGYAENPLNVVMTGTGPGGLGALRNSGGSIGNGKKQLTSLTLTGDALLKSNANFGLLASGYGTTTLTLNGHTLTLDYAKNANCWFVNTHGESAGTVRLVRGIANFRNKEDALPNVDLVVDGADAKLEIPSSTSCKTTLRAVTVQNGGWFYNGNNVCYLQDLTLLDGARVTGEIKWIYLAQNLVVSNETSDITLVPPITGYNDTYSKLTKYGAGTFTISNNYTDQRMDGGVEIFGGMVVMGSTASPAYDERAISSQPVPVTVHAAGTLDARACTNTVLISELALTPNGTGDDGRPLGGIWTDTANTPLSIASNATFNVATLYTGPNAPRPGAETTLLAAKSIALGAESQVTVTGCPYKKSAQQLTITETAIRFTVKDKFFIFIR